jgi:hypothetical protein
MGQINHQAGTIQSIFPVGIPVFSFFLWQKNEFMS